MTFINIPIELNLLKYYNNNKCSSSITFFYIILHKELFSKKIC
jgi:hypothetical protein